MSSRAFAANSGVTYQGRILKPDGTALSGANTQFKLQIRTPDAGNCLMYEELQSQDLRNSNGMFSLTINDGTGSRTDSTGLTLDKIFANHGTFSLDVTTCSAGSGSYAPNPNEGRNLVVLFKDETMSAWEPIPAQKINFVPFAFEAKQVAGFTSQSLVRVAEADGTLDLVSPLSNAQYTELLALVNGTTTQYSKASQLGGVALPTMNSGEVLGWNGTSWVSTAAVGGANSVSSTMLQASSVTTNAIANNVSISTTGTLASAITTTRDFKIYAASPSTFAIDMQAPALSASYSLVWPMNAGSANQVLTTDGSGNLSWAAPASSSQWTTSGSNIYYNTGLVGIGTTSPSEALHVVGNVKVTGNLYGNTGYYLQSTNSAAAPTYAFNDGSRTTGLFNVGTTTIGISTNGTEKMRIDGSGNVGIGTTSPSAVFHVVSPSGTHAQMRIQRSANTDRAEINYVPAGTLSSSNYQYNSGIGATSNDWTLRSYDGTSGSTLLDVTGAGLFSSRGAPVSASFPFTMLAEDSTSFGQDVGGGLGFRGQYTSGGSTAYLSGIKGGKENATDGDYAGYVAISTRPTSGAASLERVRVDSTGRVGIGTTSPTARLQLSAGTATAGTAPLKFTQGTLLTTAEDGAMEYTSSGLWFTIGSTRYVVPINTAAGNYSNVSTISNSSGSITMSPMAGNSVVVNSTTVSTDSTSGALIVSGGAGIAGAVNASGNITSGGAVTATTNMVTPQLYGSTAASGNIKIDGTSNATPGNVLLATAGGNVGIGSTSPSSKLEVQGSAAASTIQAVIKNVSSTGSTKLIVSNDTGLGYGGFEAIGSAYANVSARNSVNITSGKDMYITTAASSQNGGTGSMYFLTGGWDATTQSRMMIDSVGNVGIGTTSPTALLSLYQNSAADLSLSVQNAYSGKGAYVTTNANSLYSSMELIGTNGTGQDWKFGMMGSKSFTLQDGTASTNPLVVENAAPTSSIYVRANGNVGIGIASPSNYLGLNGTANRTIGMERTGNSANNGRSLTVTAGGAYVGGTDLIGGDLYLSSGIATGTGSSNMYFQTVAAGVSGASDRNPATAMTILGSGNVGIGTTNPSGALHIASTGSFIFDRYGSTANFQQRRANGTVGSATAVASGDELARVSGAGYDGSSWSSGGAKITFMASEAFDATHNGTNMRFYVTPTASTTQAEAMRIDAAGNVGIGTTSPVAMLNVHGGSIVSDTTANASGVVNINFATGNVQTSANSTSNQAFKICGIQDGGSYSLVLTAQPTGSTPSFTAYSDAACSSAITYVDTGGVTLTTTSATTILTFIRAGSTVYVMMATGFTH